MASERALPDLKSKISVDTSGLKRAEAEAKVSGGGLSGMFGGLSGSAKGVTKDLEGMGHETSKEIPILGKMGGMMGGLPLPALAAAAAIGLLALGTKSVMEISEKYEVSQKGLEQATKASGVSYDDARNAVDKFISSNKRFVSNQAEVVDSYAALTRQGISQKQATEDLNLALDLSTLKHISLASASAALQKVEMGKGKALIELGISMKDYPIMMETQHQADLKVAAAEALVEKATLAHTAAVKAHGTHSAQAAATAKLLADANAKLADAHDYAAKRAAASLEIHKLLHEKLDGGRKTISESTQAQNEMSNMWQTFAEKVGPVLTHMLAKIQEAIVVVMQAIFNVIDTMGTWHGLWDVLGKIMGVVASALKDTFVGAIQIATPVIQGIVNLVKLLWQGFTDVVSVVQDVIKFIGQIKVPSIALPFGIGGPQKHDTGGTAAYTGLHWLEQGERVLNADQQRGGAGGGHTFNLHVHGNSDATDPEANRRMLQRMAFMGLAS